MQRSLLHDKPVAEAGVKWALLSKGFRPFFLLAGLYGALFLPIWLLVLNGVLAPNEYLGGTFWHAHEMLFGFALATIAGFLLTAISNWTSRETVVGAPLGVLALLWLLGRVAVLLSDRLPRPLPAVVDLAFLPALAVACARPIFHSANTRNYQFVGMLSALFLANLAMHLDALGVLPGYSRRGAWLATYAITLMMVVMTARIVPMFTKNATDVQTIKSLPKLDRAAAAGVVILAVIDLAGVDERIVAPWAAMSGVLVLARTAFWGTRHTFRQPLLWILHSGNAFIGLGLLLRGATLLTPAVTLSASLHALTAGAIGSLTLGMMARVSLGHTGRMLAPKPIMAFAFGAVTLSALIRVFGPMAGSTAYRHSMLTGGVLFALAFLIFVLVYARVLTAPRVDGRPG
ncbi:MAG: NnrS family protein [Myxococcales bacterium]|nr:NnrS family protein [Myxococcales bacterium]